MAGKNGAAARDMAFLYAAIISLSRILRPVEKLPEEGIIIRECPIIFYI